MTRPSAPSLDLVDGEWLALSIALDDGFQNSNIGDHINFG
jgi:hypothetical protein